MGTVNDNVDDNDIRQIVHYHLLVLSNPDDENLASELR